MLLSKQPLSRTEIYNGVETSVNSDGEHSKSLADKEGDYAKASELYSRSLESADFNSDGDFVSSDVDLNGDFDKVLVDLKFDSNGVSRDFKLLRDGLNVRVRVGRLTDSGNIFFRKEKYGSDLLEMALIVHIFGAFGCF